MRLEQLEYVEAVCRHGSLRRAGAELHVSQPALSEGLRKLERELGVELFDRHRSGSRMSQQGIELLGHITDVLSAVDRLRAAAGVSPRRVRALRVGTVDAATVAVLVPAIQALRGSGSVARVEVLSMLQADVERGLAEGSLDAGLVNVLPGDLVPDQLVSEVLLRGRVVAVLPAGHELADPSRPVDVAALRGEPFVAMRSGCLMHRVAQRLFGQRPPAAVYSVDGAEMGKTLVAEGAGVSILPDYSLVGDPLSRAGAITWRPIADVEQPVRLVLRTRARSGEDLALSELRRALVAAVEEQRPASRSVSAVVAPSA